ncbi:hypothetical protein ACFP3I_23015 [Chryseobacterium arachidis]|uniref:hypothetical protein n=1 Tax=Chryseobacterium arachidis TaxID=1416778 RepID=UPI0036104A98
MQSGKTESRSEIGKMKNKGFKVIKKTLKILLKTFGQLEISYYFCTRKYGAKLTEK